MASTNVRTFTEAGWQKEVLNADLPVLVDFWAPWCVPCRMVAPVVEAVADANEGKVIVGKLNLDEEGPIAEKYGIETIPALLLFRNGEPVDRLFGGQNGKADLQAMIDRHA
ncbi:MAG: thioredoxin [Gracilibacteraceae bacterium]|jgi:thioredoxin 1|nr:thioredoxin [Gracilibacteraceae bacterium]